MGQKVHPTGFRLGIIYDWQSKWFSEQHYRALLQEDLVIRNHLKGMMRDAGVAKVEIERNANIVTVTIHTAKPGIVIGRSGQKVDELRGELEKLTGKRIRVNIQEIRMGELDAHLVARSIADQLERRVAFRRALRQTVQRTMARGAQGCRAMVAGRLGGSEMSRRESVKDGRVPLHTIRADIDFGQAEAHTTFGRIGVKVWIYKGEKLPEPSARAQADAAEASRAKQAAAVAETPEAAATAAAEAPAAEAAAPKPAAAAEKPAAVAEKPEAPAPKPAAAAPKPAAAKPAAARAKQPTAVAETPEAVPAAEAPAPEAAAAPAPAVETEKAEE
ncbi:MAG: 30S ribosomal protein S3 [Chloroflexi bacterium]|nr:30S ribosomal protein S3 [Chloroflexota bacterium]